MYYVTNDLAIDKNTYTRLDLSDDHLTLCAGRQADDFDTIIIFFETNADPIFIGWASVDSGDVEITYDNWDDSDTIKQDDVIDEINALLEGIKVYVNMTDHFAIYADDYNNVAGEHKVYFKTTDEAYPDPGIKNINREDGYITYRASAITEMGRKCYVYWDFVAHDDDGNEIDCDYFDYHHTDCIIRYY